MSFGSIIPEPIGDECFDHEPPNPNDDWFVDPRTTPMDSIQAIKWSPVSSIIASVSWDCTVRAYQVNPKSGSTSIMAEYTTNTPPLDVCWSATGGNIVSAGCDKAVKIWSPTQSTPSIVGVHDQAIRQIACCADGSIGGNISEQIVSGGWDHELRFWDPKQSVSVSSYSTSFSPQKRKVKAVTAVTCAERVYALDLRYPLLSVCLANKKVLIFDIRNPSKPMKQMVTLLKYQLRNITLSPDLNCFAVGSVEGRCAIHSLMEDPEQKEKETFAFKCHRHSKDVYGVNATDWYNSRTMVTAGGDGEVYFWDKDMRQKIKGFPKMNLPITDAAFSADRSMLAYSTSYDWSKGIEHFQPKLQRPQLYIHKVDSSEVRGHEPSTI